MTRLALVAVALGAGVAGSVWPADANDPTKPPEHRGVEPNGYWGFAVGLHPNEARRRGFPYPPDLHEVRSTGATRVLFPVTWTQSHTRAVTVRPAAETLSDAELVRVIRAARAAGLEVVLLPLLALDEGGRADWRGVLRPSNPDAWWRSYERFILHYAELAEAEQVQMLVIGSELSSLSGAGTEARWDRLTRAVRAVYGGPLAYGANHDALDQRAPFPFVDVVGVSAYFPLTSIPGEASPEDYTVAWRRIGDRLARLRREVAKPVLLLEVGYPSVAGAGRQPWDYTSAAPIDLEEQRAAYAALTDVALGAEWLDGVLLWRWLGPGGPHDRWYTPREKPAMAEASRLLQGRARGRDISDEHLERHAGLEPDDQRNTECP